MQYVLLVDEAIRRDIEGPYHIPAAVKVGLADCLEELAQSPHVGVLNDPIFGLTKIHIQEHGSIRWRIFLFFERDDEAQIVFVKQWRVETGEEADPTQPLGEEPE